jgi:hypothetical protein
VDNIKVRNTPILDIHSDNTMPSQHVIDLCSSSDTVTKSLADNPNQEISKIVSKLFKNSGGNTLTNLSAKFKSTSPKKENEEELLDQVAKCGKFPYRPSDLFLKV